MIDFYTGEDKPLTSESKNSNQPKPAISMHLDVRPAVDSPSAIFWRVQYNAYKLFNKLSIYLPFSLGKFSFKNPVIQNTPTPSSPSPSIPKVSIPEQNEKS